MLLNGAFATGGGWKPGGQALVEYVFLRPGIYTSSAISQALQMNLQQLRLVRRRASLPL